MTLKPIDGETPNQIACYSELLLLYLREANSDVDPDRHTAEEHLPGNL